MSEEITLPKNSETTAEFTFNTPNLLLAVNEDEFGSRTFTVKMGRSVQLNHTTSTEYNYDEPESPQEFKINAQNKVSIALTLVDVLNDLIDLPTLKLPASSPSLSEYQNLVGKKAVIGSMIRPDFNLEKLHGKKVYRLDVTTIVLP
jgi:hypothetical protein